MTPDVRRAAEQDSAKAVTAFFALLDAREHEKQWSQMTSGGAWDRAGQILDTREKFLAAMAGRPEHLTIRHMITNLLVDVAADGNTATATFNLLVFAYLADRGNGPAPMAPPSAISAFRAQLRPEGAVWRIAYLDGETLFKS
jgi:hypothetical protein